MPIVIDINDDYAVEKSHCGIQVAFYDEQDQAVTPDSILWTLTDENGTVINSKEDESISPDTTVTIVLSGDDLQILSSETGVAVWRILTVEAIIDSDLGNNLPLKDSINFAVKNLAAVT